MSSGIISSMATINFKKEINKPVKETEQSFRQALAKHKDATSLYFQWYLFQIKDIVSDLIKEQEFYLVCII